jgi:hypothetical protein
VTRHDLARTQADHARCRDVELAADFKGCRSHDASERRGAQYSERNHRRRDAVPEDRESHQQNDDPGDRHGDFD